MLGITKVSIAPNLPLIGKDLDAEATLNADVVAAQPDLSAGTIMAYTPGVAGTTSGTMIPATDAQITGIATVPVIGILAADSFYDEQPAGTPVNRPAMVYRGGTFIRSTINEVRAGQTPALIPIEQGDAVYTALSVRGLHLEESWDENQYP